MVFVFAVFACLGTFGQQVSLPLYLHTLGSFGGPYFVLWFCSCSFTIFFGLGALVLYFLGEISPMMLQLRWQKWMVLVGLFDALNGVLIVYSAPLSRVPGPVQAVLLQASAPLTLFFSKLLLRGRKYGAKQLISVAVAVLGVFYSLIPLFVRAAQGKPGVGMHVAEWWWPVVTLAGIVPGVLMNVVQEDLQEKFRLSSNATTTRPPQMSVFFFQACESFSQLFWMSAFWFFDILPDFGTNPKSVAGFTESFRHGFECFFRSSQALADNNLCDYTPVFGLTFMACYITTYIFGTYMTMYATANYNAVVSTLPPVAATIFWFAFPSVNKWAGGTPYPLTGFDGAMNISALAIILPAIYCYRRHESDDKVPLAAELTTNEFEELKYFPLH